MTFIIPVLIIDNIALLFLIRALRETTEIIKELDSEIMSTNLELDEVKLNLKHIHELDEMYQTLNARMNLHLTKHIIKGDIVE